MDANRSTLDPIYYTNVSKGYFDIVKEKQVAGKYKYSKKNLSLKEARQKSYKLIAIEVDMKENYQQRLKPIMIPLKNYLSSEMPNSNDPRRVRQCMKECMVELLKKVHRYPAINEIQNESSYEDQSFQFSFHLEKSSESVTMMNPITGRLCQMSLKTLKNTRTCRVTTIESKDKNMNYDSSKITKTKPTSDRRSNNTEDYASSVINDNNNENNSKNINRNMENENCCPELIADAVGSLIHETLSFNKNSIKLKCNYSKYRSSAAKKNLSSQELFDDDTDDDNVFASDSTGEKNVSQNLNASWERKENIFVVNSCGPKNICERIPASENSIDMEAKVNTSEHKRISRVPNFSSKVKKETEEKWQRMRDSFKEKELKTFRKAEKRKNNCPYSSVTLHKVQKQPRQSQSLENNCETSDKDNNSNSSSKKSSPKKNQEYGSESSLQSPIKRHSRNLYHCLSPFPDKKPRFGKILIPKENIEREKNINLPLLSHNDSNSENDKSRSKNIDKSKTHLKESEVDHLTSSKSDKSNPEKINKIKIQLKEFQKQQKFSDAQELEKSKQLNERKEKKANRSSIDSGIGRVTPTPKSSDNSETGKYVKYDHQSEETYKSLDYSKGSDHSSLANYHEEDSETLERKRMKILNELNKIEKDKKSANESLSLPFISDGDGCGVSDNLTNDNPTEDCTGITNQNNDTPKQVVSANNEKISNNEIDHHENHNLHDNSTANLHDQVQKLLSSNITDYSSPSDEDAYHAKSIVSKSSVNASDAVTETNVIQSETNIKSSEDNKGEDRHPSTESKDDKSIITNKNLDTTDFSNNKEISQSSPNDFSNQISDTLREHWMKALKIITECFVKNYADSKIQKSLKKNCDNDELDSQCKSTTSVPTKEELSEILGKDLEKNLNLTELMTAFKSINKEKNSEKNEVQGPVITVNVHLGIPDIITSIVTSTPSASTPPASTILTSSINSSDASIHPTVSTVPKTSPVTTESQSNSQPTMNTPCSLTTLASPISATLSTVIPTTPQVLQYQNPLLPYQNPSSGTLLTPTTGQPTYPYHISSSTSSMSAIRPSPPSYNSSLFNQQCLRSNKLSSNNSNNQLNRKNILSHKQKIPFAENEHYHRLMNEIIRSILETRIFFKEFELIIQDPNYNPSSFKLHSLFISVKKIFQFMSSLQKLLQCNWESLFLSIVAYSEVFKDSKKKIHLNDLRAIMYIFCYGNGVPTKLSSIYPSKEKIAESNSRYSNNANTVAGTDQSSTSFNTTGPQGEMYTAGYLVPNCSGGVVSNSSSNPSTSYSQQSYPLSVEPRTQQTNTTQAYSPLTTSMKMIQTQQNVGQTSVLAHLLTSTTNNQNHNQFQIPANQPLNNTPEQALGLSSNNSYNQSQYRNMSASSMPPLQANNDQYIYNQFRSPINQQPNNQVGNLMSCQSSMITPTGMLNMSNQQYHNHLLPNQYKTSISQQLNTTPTLVSSLGPDANQPYHPQTSDQPFYNQPRAMFHQSNFISTSVPSYNVNNKQQPNNLIIQHPNTPSVLVSSQTNTNQKFNNQINTSIHQQPYNAATSVPRDNNINQLLLSDQIHTQSTTSGYQQNQSAKALASHHNSTKDQQYHNEVNTLMHHQQFTAAAPTLPTQTNDNQANTPVFQKSNTAPISVPSLNVNMQLNNQVNNMISQQHITSAPTLSSNNNLQCNKEGNVSKPRSSSSNSEQSKKKVNASKSRSSSNHKYQQYQKQDYATTPQLLKANPSVLLIETNNNQQNNNYSGATIHQQQNILVATMLPSTIDQNQQNSNQFEASALAAKNHSTCTEVQQTGNMIGVITEQSNEPQQNDLNKPSQVQLQQSSVNLSTSIESGTLLQDTQKETTTQPSEPILIKNNQNYRLDNSIPVSQALESLASLPETYEEAKKQRLNKKNARQPKIRTPLQNSSKVAEIPKVCLNKNTTSSSTEASVINNASNHLITKKGIKQELDENNSTNISQQVPVHTDTQNDIILLKIKKENIFSKRKDTSHIDDLREIDLRFLNDTEFDQDCEEFVKEVKPNTYRNVLTAKKMIEKSEKWNDKVNIKSNEIHKKSSSLVSNEVITLDDDDDDEDNDVKNIDLDRVSIISSDRETVKMDQFDDDIIVEKEHITTDTYIYTVGCVTEEIDCAMSGEGTAFSNIPHIAGVVSITNDDFTNIKEEMGKKIDSPTTSVPEKVYVKQEFDENDYFMNT